MTFQISNSVTPSNRPTSPYFGDLRISFNVLDGQTFTTDQVKEITCTGTTTIGRQKFGGETINTTRGDTEYAGSIDLYRIGYDDMIAALGEVAPEKQDGTKAYGRVVFDVNWKYVIEGENGRIYQLKMTGCRVLTESFSTSEGVEADSVPIDIFVSSAVKTVNGVKLSLS